MGNREKIHLPPFSCVKSSCHSQRSAGLSYGQDPELLRDLANKSQYHESSPSSWHPAKLESTHIISDLANAKLDLVLIALKQFTYIYTYVCIIASGHP